MLLKKLTSLEEEASAFGFKWETAEQIIAQIRSEISEVDVHLKDGDQQKLQIEIGDLLHAVFSLCNFCNFDCEETLNQSVKKFEQRLRLVQQLAAEQGLTSLNGQPFPILMKFWDHAKTLESK